MSLQICHCGWSKYTTYQGLRIHQGKKGCTPKGRSIPESEQFRFNNDLRRQTYHDTYKKVEDFPLKFAAEVTTKETNKSAFQTPPHYSTTHQATATTGNARRALDFSTGAQQFGQQVWHVPKTTAQETVKPKEREMETEMEKEREAQELQRRRDFSVESGSKTNGNNGKHGVHRSSPRSLERLRPALSPPTMELLNIQSLTKKALLIYDHILDKGLDFMCLTETWHKLGDCSVLDEACPPGYKYMEKARSSGPCGGLAIMHRAELNLTPLPMCDLSSMECLAFKCESPYSMTVLLIYRPPKPNPSFVPEIRGLLTALCAMSTNIIIVGDFNIHVDNPSRKFEVDFLRVLECLGLQQHVEVATHTKGHTLDLVITDSASISNLQVYDLDVSDHKVVSMDLTIGPKRQMCFWNWKDPATMTMDLQFITCPAFASMDELVELSNTSLSSVFVLHDLVSFKARQDRMRAELQQKIQTREQKMSEVRSSVKACKGGLDAEWLEINNVFSEVMRVVEDARQTALRPVEERRKRGKREAQDLVQKLQKEIDKLKMTIDELDKNPDFQVLPQSGLVETCDWKNVTVDTSFSFGTLRTTTSIMMEEIHQELEKLSSVELKRIPTFAVDVKLDPTTAHPCLVLSPDGKMVSDGGKNQKVPDAPQRFDMFGSLLGFNRLTSGKSYWEVEVSNKTGWDLGVARRDAKRKGRVSLNPDNGYWVTVHYEDEKYAALTVPPVSLSLTEKPQKVGVFVDYEEGLVSFYDVVAKSHIYSFTECSFGGGIFPYFSPHLKQNEKNSHPLIISAVVVDA